MDTKHVIEHITPVVSCPFCSGTDFGFSFGILKCNKCGEELSIDDIELQIKNGDKEVCYMTHVYSDK